MFKSTLLLAIALFLITAPAPDAADLAEATHGLFADDGSAALQASEPADACTSAPDAAPSDAGQRSESCGETPAAP